MPGINSTIGVFSNSGSMTNIFLPLVLVGIALIALLILINMSGDIKKYRRFMALFKKLEKTFSYCAYGMLTFTVIFFPVFIAYNVYTAAEANPEGAGQVLKFAGLLVGAFIGFTAIGYLTKNRIWKNLFKFYKEDKQIKEVKEVNYERKTKA